MKSKIINYLKENDLFYSLIKNTYIIICKIKMNIRKVIFRLSGFIFILFPIKRKKIVISNYFGKGYGDNGKYIAEEIIKQNLDYDIVWLLKEDLFGKTSFPKEIRVAKYDSLHGLYELATSKVWIDNCRKFFYSPKRKEQFYIQTWHGGLGIKKIEGDAGDQLDYDYIKAAKKDSKMADLFISNSIHLTNIYKRAFWYSGEIIESGYPKNDILFKENTYIKKKIKSFYKLSESMKILLYAPTFRVDCSLNSYNIDYLLLLKVLNEKTNEDWAIFIRLHPNLISSDSEIVYSENIINATNYPDMQELIIGCDILISDYSSCLFDSGMMKIPTFIYASDIEHYLADRGLYFSFSELPFPLATNNEELFNNIINFNQVKYVNEICEFNKKAGLKDQGNASENVLKIIKKVVGE